MIERRTPQPPARPTSPLTSARALTTARGGRPSFRRRPRRFAPSLLPAALLLLPLLVLLAGCGGQEPLEEADAVAPPVEALPARSGSLPLEERLNGVVRADNQVVVRPEISGRVVEVLVRNGDAVRRGEPLVRIDPQGLGDRLRQAQADVRLAEAEAAEARARVAELEAEVSRTRRLAAEDLVSDMDLETLEARLDAAEAAAASAAARVDQAAAAADESRFGLEQAVVRAPADGRVGRLDVEVGTLADPGTALFTLGDLGDLVVEIPLTEEMLAFIEEGQPVRLRPRSGGRTVEATLSRISPFLEPGSFTTTGEIDVEGSTADLRPGMFVTVDVLYGESERATLVPASALWEDPQSGVQGIYVFTEVPRGVEVPAEPSRDEGDGDLADRVLGASDADITAAAEPADPSTEAWPVELRPVLVIAEGRAVLGVEGIEPGEWVVVVGQHLLAAAQEPRARVRATSWDRLLGLQGLQREDLLASFLAKQQRLAGERGAEPPSNEEFLTAAPAAPAAESASPPDAPAAAPASTPDPTEG